MKKILYISVVLSLCAFLKVQAQYDVHFTHYWEMQNFYNPAGAGASRKMHAYAAYSNQFSGFENSPKSMLINLDSPLSMFKGDHSLGVGVLNEEIGLFTNQHLYLNYAFGFKLFKGRFVAGAQIGLVNAIFDRTDIKFPENDQDPAFPSAKADGNNIDFGAGILYQHKYFYTGLSALHINAPLIILGESNEIRVSPYFNFMAGGNIPLKNPLLSIQPSLQVMTDLVGWRADITAKGSYKYKENIFFGGVTYSPTASVAAFLGMEFLNITISYGYELYTQGVGAENGSHDIFIGYKLDLNIFKKGKNKHNSIRVLQ